MNLPPEILNQQLEQCIESDELSSEFARSAIQIAKGWIASNRSDLDPYQVDECIAHLSRRLIRKWSFIDPAGNVFSYITGMTRYSIMDHERKWKRHQSRNVEMDDSHLSDSDSLRIYRITSTQAQL